MHVQRYISDSYIMEELKKIHLDVNVQFKNMTTFEKKRTDTYNLLYFIVHCFISGYCC